MSAEGSATAPGGAAPGDRTGSADALLLERLRAPGPLVTVELRPPSARLAGPESMDAWIDLHHAIERVVRDDTFVFLTDRAVGSAEEENLEHTAAALIGEVDPARVVPFLTCKHTLEYCLLYAERAAARGLEALTVLGGDTSVGPPRCVPHAYQLRQRIRRRVPGLVLGGWANPHRDAAEQVGYLTRGDFTADFYLTQVVSHHSLDAVEAFLEEAERQGVDVPGVFGVFYYRSANPETLARLGEFFPVPADGVTREFEAGATPEEICARSIRALRDAGAEKVYVSNLGGRRAAARYRRILEAVEEGP